MPNTVVMWIAQDVFGATLTWPEAREALARMNRESVLGALAMLNAVTGEFIAGRAFPRGAVDRSAIQALANYLLAPEHRPRALQIWKDNSHQLFMPLAPQAGIAMTEAALRFCDPSSGRFFTQPSADPDFARVLLSFQDALNGEEIRTHAGSLDFASLSPAQFADFTRNYLTVNFESGLMALMRRFHMMFVLGEEDGVTRQKTGRSSPEWFQHVTGIPPRTFAMLPLVAMFHTRQFEIRAPDLRTLVYDLEHQIANLAPVAAEAYRRLHASCVMEPVLPPLDLPDWTSAVYHQNHLRLRPVIEIGKGKHLCLHRQLMIEKFFAGTVHVLTELVVRHPPADWSNDKKGRIEQVRREMGHVFEDYLRRLIRTVFADPRAVLDFGVTYPGGEGDFVVILGTTALAIEAVHHPWSLAERAHGTPQDFIKKHLVDNVKKATRMCRRLLQHGHRVGDTARPVTRAIPIIVMSDTLPSNELTSGTLERFLIQSAGAEDVMGSDAVLPIQTLSVTQFENLDRLNAAEGPAPILAFLELRARDPLGRFNGKPHFGDKVLGPEKRLVRYSNEAELSCLTRIKRKKEPHRENGQEVAKQHFGARRRSRVSL